MPADSRCGIYGPHGPHTVQAGGWGVIRCPGELPPRPAEPPPSPPPTSGAIPRPAEVDCGHVTCQTYVTVTYADGQTTRYRCHDHRISDGVLIMWEPLTGTERKTRCIPLANIREFAIRNRR